MKKRRVLVLLSVAMKHTSVTNGLVIGNFSHAMRYVIYSMRQFVGQLSI